MPNPNIYIKTASFRLIVQSDEQREALDQALVRATDLTQHIVNRSYSYVRRIAVLNDKKTDLDQEDAASKDLIDAEIERNRLIISNISKKCRSQEEFLSGGIRMGCRDDANAKIDSYLELAKEPTHIYPRTRKNKSFILSNSSEHNFLFLRHKETKHLYLYLCLHGIKDLQAFRILMGCSGPEFNRLGIDLTPFEAVGGVRTNWKAQKGKNSIKTVVVPPRARGGYCFRLDYDHRYHYQRYVESGGIPKSVVVSQKGPDYYAHVAFEFPRVRREYRSVMGIDRGINNIAAYCCMRENCSIVSEGLVDGKMLSHFQTQQERRKALRQKVGHIVRSKKIKHVAEHMMQRASIVLARSALAVQACPVWEDLEALKNGPHHKRPRGKKRSPANYMLNKARYGRLMELVENRMYYGGYPRFNDPWMIHPAYTSQTCSHCGYSDRTNRSKINREDFSCIRCGNALNADLNAARNIAAKGVFLFESMKKNSGKPKGEKVKWSEFSAWYEQKLQSLYGVIPERMEQVTK